MKKFSGHLFIAFIGILIYVFGADFERGWDAIQTRERIVTRWNTNEPEEQFYVTGIAKQNIHVVLSGSLSGDADRIIGGLVGSRGLVDELVRDGFVSIECNGRVVPLKHWRQTNSAKQDRKEPVS
jgi:hypothetical protein